MRYNIKINYSFEIEAENQDEALEKFWELYFNDNDDKRIFLNDILEVEEVKK